MSALPRIVLTTPQDDAHVYQYGAHVTHYHPRGAAPVLFMSRESLFASGKPIRGGVPVIFPWFGPKQDDPAAPAHGLARVSEWRVESSTQDAVTLRLDLNEYSLRYQVTIGGALRLALEVENTSDKPVCFEEALHTYLSVSDVRKVSIEGLDGVAYLDKPNGFKRKTQSAEPIRITAETDRVYLNTRATCIVNDPGSRRRILVEKSGSDSTVVWNPWIAKAKAMPDFGDDEWERMLCIETANVAENAITLAPGQTHTMQAMIRSESL